MKTAREIIAPIIEPVGFSMKPEDYGLETQEQFTRTLAYGSQLVAFDKADAILAALAAEGFSIVETGPGRINLPARERRAFDKLMERPGSVITSEALIAAIWPDADGGPENAADVLSHVICRLRSALGDAWRITTHRHLGYSATRVP